MNSNNIVNSRNTKQLPSDTVYEDNISFHPKQLQYLQKNFPNIHKPHTAPDSLLRHHNGQQSVIEFIASRVK